MSKPNLKPSNDGQQSPEDTIATMAVLLRTLGTDLDNEREVMRALIGARYRSGDVMLFMDRAIARARAPQQAGE